VIAFIEWLGYSYSFLRASQDAGMWMIPQSAIADTLFNLLPLPDKE
jgi:hypothetical protein